MFNKKWMPILAIAASSLFAVSCQASADKQDPLATQQPQLSQKQVKKPTLEDVKANVAKSIPDLAVSEVRTTPIAGLYELQVGNQLFYANAEGSHLIAGGHIFETATRKDLTKARIDEINTVDWSILPLDKAIVSGDPEGKEIAVFTDPECPYCKRLESELKLVKKGIKVYTFLYPLTSLHPNAKAKAESIWCAKDKHQAMLDVMLDDKTLPKADCTTPIDTLQVLGNKLAITGTPTMIARDGRKFAGYKKAEDLVEWATAGQ